MIDEKVEELLKDWFDRDAETYVKIRNDRELDWEGYTSAESYTSYLTNDKDLQRILRNAHTCGRNIITSMMLPFKVKLVLSKESDSFTNGKRVVVSTQYFDDPTISDGIKLDVFYGITIHECCHLLYTDFAVMPKNKLIMAIANILEDERIENLLGDSHPGFARYIEQLKNYFFTKSKKEPDNEFKKIMSIFFRLIRYPKGLTVEEVTRFKDKLVEIKEVLTPFPTDTKKVMAAAEEIYEILKDLLSTETSKEMSDESGASTEEVTKAVKELLEGAMSEDTSEEVAEIARKVVEKLEKAIESAEASDLSDIQNVPDTLDTPEECKKVDRDFLPMLDGAFSLGESKFTYLRPAPDDKEEYKEALKAVKKYIPSVRKALKYRDKDFKVVHKGALQGRLDTNKLVNAHLHELTVYERIGSVLSDKIAVVLVVDQSGSMEGAKIRAARDVAILFNEALAWNSSIELYAYGHTADLRGMSTDITIFREGKKNPTPYALGSVESNANNRDGQAIREIVNRVRKQTNRKALMIYIADGQPSAYDYYGSKALDDVRSAVKFAESKDVIILNVAIDSSYDPSSMFQHYVKLTDLATLSRDLSQVMKRLLSRNQKIKTT